ncbi:MAG: DUF72 domain-containing protein [Gemmatimonadaceae bacterium]
MRILAGTSGYAYKEWKGSFYPSDIKPDAMLRFYAERFSTVEINNTFYKMPTERVLLAWLGQVPTGFKFVLKASQRITHRKRLRDASEEVAYFLRIASVLGDRLGPTLFQLPPNLKKDISRLKDFLTLIPRGWRSAFEFRHDSWFDEETYDVLRSRNAAMCIADNDEDVSSTASNEPAAAGANRDHIVSTGNWGYLRLRRASYDDASLSGWYYRISTQPWSDAFVFFKHEDEGTGPRLAARFMELSARPPEVLSRAPNG